MKRIFPLVGLFVTILLASCQKEIGWEPVSEPLLIKSVQKTGTDSVVITYSYDGSRRLTRQLTVGMANGIDAGNDIRVIRNGSGTIIYTVQKSAALLSAGLDSLQINYYYNSSTKRYTSAVFNITFMGFTVTDSADFQYDGSGILTTEIHYQKIPSLPPIPGLKIEYTYSNGNLASSKQYSFDPTSFSYDLLATVIYTYDNKSNPLKLGRESFFIGALGYYGNNNAIKTELTNTADPTIDFTDNIVFTYNSSGKPISGTSTRAPGATISNLTFYYQ